MSFCWRKGEHRRDRDREENRVVVYTLGVERRSGKMGTEREIVLESKVVQNNHKETNSILGLRAQEGPNARCVF